MRALLRWRSSSAPVLLACALAAAWANAPAAPAEVRYGRDIRPILSDRCFRCHGPDPGERQADLRLDSFEGATAMREHGAPIVPGAPGKSELWRRVRSHDANVRMPPPSANKKPLDERELALVRRWIESGAQYEPHWAFTPPAPQGVPAAPRGTKQSPVDAFVHARLQAEKLAPSPRASEETLIRRLFLDLTGLPPAPEEVDAYLADRRADRWERWIERLLVEEPYRSRYAERMAIPWLDAARYADTSGIHMDAGRSIWPWRDWVLAAYRDNMPYDRFLVEQLAGDLLPDATLAQKVASGFNRNHVTTDEGGAIDEEYKVEYAVDRTATTGSVFMGLTLGCARCHDHKFDPLSQQEFYGLYAFFDSNEEPGLYSQVADAKRALEPFLDVPTPEQAQARDELASRLEEARARLDDEDPAEEAQRAAFLEELVAEGVDWPPMELVDARSEGGATLTRQADGSVLASGANPDKDDLVFSFRTQAQGLRALLVEALTDPTLPGELVGRAPNGNAVLSAVTLKVRSVADPARAETVELDWAWADQEQQNGDFRAVNVLEPSGQRGWGVAAHQLPGPRTLLLLAREPFGFEGGTELEVVLQHRSVYAQHVLGRVRVRAGRLDDAVLARLPAASSGWYVAGPFAVADRAKVYATEHGPEKVSTLDLAQRFGEVAWRFDQELLDGTLNALPAGINATYVAKRLFVPGPRTVEVSLGSDDGLRIFLDGDEVIGKQVDRALLADQDRVELVLARGTHTVVFKVVNTGGKAGFYWRELRREGELEGPLVAAVLPEEALRADLAKEVERQWRLTFSPAYLAGMRRIAELEKELAALQALIPRTMVMKELERPRETFLLVRGRYDMPDRARPTPPAIPAVLGRLPEGAPANRLGLARWLTSPDHPLVARVAVNRLWELLFGTGLVATSEDFGLQGDWPSHPELLDWLARDLIDGGWDLQRTLRLLLASETYRQASRRRPEVAAIDPSNRMLAYFPRKRLEAELIRDQALYVSGLLVERLGGPSVKPYQPEGLWQEVAMPQSNTRVYERGSGGDLWRRSLYTYWKRASPPPSMLSFDAPTREACTIRRSTTNTPLQALVLWNDPQLVEAARVLAERTLCAGGDDDERLAEMFRRCTSRRPEPAERELLREALERFRERYRGAPEDARALISVGEAPAAAELEAAELAAWTLVASSMLNLEATLVRD